MPGKNALLMANDEISSTALCNRRVNLDENSFALGNNTEIIKAIERIRRYRTRTARVIRILCKISIKFFAGRSVLYG